MSRKRSEFETLSLSSLIHSNFHVRSEDLIVHLMFHDSIDHYAERALLTDLIFRHMGDQLPELKPGEAQAYWDELTTSLDYRNSERVEEFLADLGVTIEQVSTALDRYLRVQHYVRRYAARSLREPRVRANVLWQAFFDGSLRTHIVRAASTRLVADASTQPLDESDRMAARSACEARQGRTWREIEKRMLVRWKVPQERLDAAFDQFARAYRGSRS